MRKVDILKTHLSIWISMCIELAEKNEYLEQKIETIVKNLAKNQKKNQTNETIV